MLVYYKKYFKKATIGFGSVLEMIGYKTSHWEARRTELSMVIET